MPFFWTKRIGHKFILRCNDKLKVMQTVNILKIIASILFVAAGIIMMIAEVLENASSK